MNQCLYEPIHGEYPNWCNGACKKGPNKYCTYYYVDEICKIINEWCKEARVKEPVLIKKDYKRKKFIIYTTRPGYLIGYHGKLIEKYGEQLNKELVMYFVDENGIPEDNNFIEIKECDEVIGWNKED